MDTARYVIFSGVYWCYLLSIVAALLLHFIFIHEDDNININNSDFNRRVQYASSSLLNVAPHFRVVIGVLSHRGHFTHRQIIRDGLLKQQQHQISTIHSSFTWKFLVAEHPCMVPPDDRRDVYECEWDTFVSPSAERFYFHQTLSQHSGARFLPPGPIGFDFVTNNEISVSHLGVYDHDNNGFRRVLKVTLYDTHTQKELITRTFLPFGVRGSVIHGSHVYKDVEKLTLPKGFRGSVILEGASSDDPLFESNNCCIDDGEGLITYLPGYRFGNQIGQFPKLRKQTKSFCNVVGPSLIYSFDSMPEYNTSKLVLERTERYNKLQKRVRRNKELLVAEQTKHGDLLFVDAVEHYRNLALKMLHFYNWLSSESFDFAMKTDDDSFVNMTSITNFLNLNLDQENDLIIGNFRTNWEVNKHGKWGEYDYESLTYPPFPCGSGYLLSYDLVRWIATNRNRLKCYQGEDVSIGIWLAAIDALRLHDERFLCTAGRVNMTGLFSMPNNHLSDLKLLYGT